MEKIVIYKNLSWYVISENEKEKLLFLIDCFTREQALRYFDSKIVDKFGGVEFSRNHKRFWWEDSIVRDGLKEKFLVDLNPKDLNVMKTTLELGEEQRTVEDLVRLLRVEESSCLRKNQRRVLNASRDYWLMDSSFDDENIKMYCMEMCSYPGRLGYWSALNLLPSVRPIISLKPESSENLIFRFEHEEEAKIEIKKIIDILNYGVDVLLWTTYYFRFCSYRNVTGPVDYMELLNVLGKALLKTMSLISEEQIEDYDKKKRDIEEFLGNSRKLIIVN